MKLFILFLSGLVAFANSGYAQNIYKCEGPEGIAYRDTPCPTQREEQTVMSSARKASWQMESARAPDPAAATPFSATRLFIGMTDTQVLNLPSWGRPAQIVRSKSGRMWREQWVYKDRSIADERRLLYFENGRLVAQEDAPPPPSIQARATIE
jgi:hypothetical protein